MKQFFYNWVVLQAMLCCLCFTTTLNAQNQQSATIVSVKTGKIQRRTLNQYLDVYGLVEPEPAVHGKPSASSKVASPIAGLLTKVLCEEGQHVTQGDVLFELDARAADEVVAKADIAVDYAQKNFDRKQFLYSNNNTSLKLFKDAEQQLENARKDLSNAHTQREMLRIKAPLSGTISAIHFKTGEAVSMNTMLADLIDLKRLDVALKVPTAEAGAVHTGQTVAIFTRSESNIPEYQAKVIFISPQVDPLTDTVLVRAEFLSDNHIRPGQFVFARIRVVSKPDALVVPVDSIVRGEMGDRLFLVNGKVATSYPIRTGIKENGWIEILGADLQTGMTVVTEGAYGLPVESNIRVQP